MDPKTSDDKASEMVEAFRPLADAASVAACVKKPRRRKLIVLETYTTGSGDGQKFGCHSSLPMHSANAVESENAAARIMQATNAQLDFAGSDMRLVMYDVKKKQYLKISFGD
jgi:hypothetical protein